MGFIRWPKALLLSVLHQIICTPPTWPGNKENSPHFHTSSHLGLSFLCSVDPTSESSKNSLLNPKPTSSKNSLPKKSPHWLLITTHSNLTFVGFISDVIIAMNMICEAMNMLLLGAVVCSSIFTHTHTHTAHQAEVLAVVERADKDIAIESLLNTFEEVWLSRQLELKTHLRAGRHEVGSVQQRHHLLFA